MTPKTLITTTRVLSDHRYDLSYDVNTRIAKFVEECNNANAKVTVDMGEERPIGPFGQWCQTVTYTVLGDYVTVMIFFHRRGTVVHLFIFITPLALHW